MFVSNTDKLIADQQGPVAWITFNNPARHNAMSMSMWEALGDAVAHFEAAPEVRVIVLKGAGDKAFVSGADISEFKEKRSSPESVKLYNEVAGRANERLHQTVKPTIAMIRGYCIGGGLGLALGCDLRIAAVGSTFGVPAARLGLGYDFKGVRKLVDVVGPSFAKEVFFTARQFTSNEALAMGLINRMVPVSELDERVNEYARTIAANAPLTVTSIKTIVTEMLKDEAVRDMALCDEVVDRCFKSEDYVEGRTAFMEKRVPLFKGR